MREQQDHTELAQYRDKDGDVWTRQPDGDLLSERGVSATDEAAEDLYGPLVRI